MAKRKKSTSKPKLPPGRCDTDNSTVMLHASADELMTKLTIRYGYDVPYLAGYNRRGDVVYIDRHLPRMIAIGGRRVDVHRYVITHEAIEKALLRAYDLAYQHAHQFAQRAEKDLVESEGVGWRDYDDAIQKYIKVAGDERLQRVPADLDLEPYRDEKDFKTLHGLQQQMMRQKRGRKRKVAQ